MQRGLTHPRKSSWATATMDRFKLTGLLSELSLLELWRDSQGVRIKTNLYLPTFDRRLWCNMRDWVFLCSDDSKKIFSSGWLGQHLTTCVWWCNVLKAVQWSKQWACCVELVSSLELLRAICLPLSSVASFIKPQTETWSGQTQNLFTRLSRKTNSSLCVSVYVCVCEVCVTVCGRVTCGSVAQSWSSVRRLPAFGQKTSNQQTAGQQCGERERTCKNMWWEREEDIYRETREETKTK